MRRTQEEKDKEEDGRREEKRGIEARISDGGRMYVTCIKLAIEKNTS